MELLLRFPRWLVVFTVVWTLAVPLGQAWFGIADRLVRGYDTWIAWKVWFFPLLLAWIAALTWRWHAGAAARSAKTAK